MTRALGVALAVALGGCGRCGGAAGAGSTSTATSTATSTSTATATGAARLDGGHGVFTREGVDLHLGGIGGPVVARAHAGASFASARDVGGGVVAVTLLAFHEALGKQTPLELFAPARTFDTGAGRPDEEQIVSRAEDGGAARLVADMPPLDVLATRGDADPFASTLCGELRVVVDGDRVRVAQTHAGVELFGWIDAPLPTRGPARGCTMREVDRDPDGGALVLSGLGTTSADTRVVVDVPAGYVSIDRTATDALGPELDRGGSVQWLVASASRHEVVCRRWEFVRGSRDESGEGVLRLTTPITVDHVPAFASFLTKYAKDRRELTLLGPHFTSAPRARASTPADRGGYKCGTVYAFVGQRDGALRMLPGAWSASRVAWHPDDEELWYPTEASCAAAAAKATAALARDPDATPPGGLHVDCYAELVP